MSEMLMVTRMVLVGLAGACPERARPGTDCVKTAVWSV